MKNKYVLFGFIILEAFILNTCKKDKTATFTLKGIVLDKSYGNVVTDAKITLWANKIQTGIYSSGYEELTTFYTDKNGEYNVNVKLQKTAGYKISIRKYNYFDYDQTIPADNFQPGGSYYTSYSIAPVGYITIRAVNKFPYNKNDFISYRFTNGYLDCFSCCNNVTIKGYGENFDSTYTCMAVGGTQLIISWNVIKNGQYFYNNNPIYCKPFDTTYFEISY
ncbi:MAG TPA: hypothetical protein P5250_01465 [Bacteroidales bacterium]|nr:hypothetical protein [Bacteroidales bacterium]